MSSRISERSSSNRTEARARASSVLPTPGGAEEEERADRLGRQAQADARASDGPGDAGHRLVLADDAPVEFVLHAQQARGLLLLDLEHRDAGHLRHYVGDVVLGQFGNDLVLVLLPILLAGFQLAPLPFLVVAQAGRQLVILDADGGHLLGGHDLDAPLHLLDLRRHGDFLEAHPRAGLVEHVDGLVGQEAVAYVAVGHLGRRLDGRVGDPDAVVRLVARAQAAHDGDGLVDRGGQDDDRLEAALERPVLLDVLAVFVQGGRADALHLAPSQGRLEHAGGVDRPFRRAGADDGVQLVDEDDDAGRLGDLLHDRLETLLELAPVLGAGHQGAEVEGDDAAVVQRLGDEPGDDALGQPLGDGRLADARFADQHRVVLGPARQDLDHPLDLVVAADDRVELPLLGQQGQVAAELVQQRRVLLGFLLGRGRLLEGDGLLADPRSGQAEGLEDPGGVARIFLEDAQKEVFGAYVVLAQEAGLLDGQLKDFLGPRRKGDLAQGQDVLAGGHPGLDLGFEAPQREAHVLQHGHGHPAGFPDDAQEEVLGAQVLVLALFGLGSGEDDHPPGPLGEFLEHRTPLVTGQNIQHCGPRCQIALFGLDGPGGGEVPGTSPGCLRGHGSR